MVLNDPLANVLSNITMAEKKGRKTLLLKNNSKMIRKVLDLLKDNNYLGSYVEHKDDKGGYLEINLIGNINKTGVIKPRYKSKVEDYKKFEKRFLPAFGFGFLIVSTTKGLMTHEEAIKNNLGGRLIAFVY
ncbi:MAG: 30S ribosomal protein S8 [Candidatus Woesearchaeota archaeon]